MGHKAVTACLVVANRTRKEASTEYRRQIDELIVKVLDRI